jgi:uncharacterized membrane protein YgcG
MGGGKGALVKMSFARTLRHFLTTRWSVSRAFPKSALDAIERAIAASEQKHGGEIRFAVEGELITAALWRDLAPRERAVQVFGELGVWDTESNNGVLIYVLLADRDVEIVADRGYAGKVSDAEWTAVCSNIEKKFREGEFELGAVEGIHAIGSLIARHYPVTDRNELPNRPALL